MTSRKSSGSMRAESAVEPTKSENITVTGRRSAAVLGSRYLKLAQKNLDGDTPAYRSVVGFDWAVPGVKGRGALEGGVVVRFFAA
jgi:hypothetical protein